MNLGIAQADQYDLEGALASFTTAVELAPESVATRYNKGRVLYDLGRHEDARTELQMATGVPEAVYLLAMIEKQRGSSARSRELLQQVVTALPSNADALYQLGLNHSQAGQRQTAVGYWRRAVDVNPEHGQALYNLARALRDASPDEAVGFQERFRKHREERRITDRAETLGNFALASADARDWPQAVDQLLEAINVCGKCPTQALLHKNLGLIYARSGNLDKAEASLRVASALLPSDEDIETSLQLIVAYKSRMPSSN